jgi:hypothetical protein
LIIYLTIHEKITAITVNARVQDGISLSFLLANAVQGVVVPSFPRIARICKQIVSASDEYKGRYVIELLCVRSCDIVTYILGVRRNI